MDWTREQRETIETTGKNILVSAAAGSGKTTVLVERIKNLVINEGADIDRFLITTFTKAAAAEMKGRLESAFRQAGLSTQLQKLPGANISTFHSFAIEIIRQYFYLTDLEPGFGIADEIQMSIMKKEALDKVFARRYQEDYENLREFLLKYSKGKGDDRLKDNILDTYKTLVSIPDYMDWASRKAELIGGENPMEALGAYSYIAWDIKSRLGEALEQFEMGAEALNTDGLERLYEKAKGDADNVAGILERASGIGAEMGSGAGEGTGGSGVAGAEQAQIRAQLEALEGCLCAFERTTLRANKDEKPIYEGEPKDLQAKYRGTGKEIIDGILGDYFDKPFEDFEQDLRDVYQDTLYYIDIIREFVSVLKGAKAEACVIDFDDVMHYAIEILKSPEAAEELKEKFDYIFIDEYQDSNYLQEEIVGRIVRDNNLFMVGDVKQCIYKFRLAEPELFRDKARLYDKPEEEKSILLNLNSNFRSKKNVTEPVNDLFAQVMDGYDDSAKLHCTAPEEHPGLPARIHIINREDFDEAAPDKGEAEAAVIAGIIRERLGEEIYDTKTGEVRKLRKADFAVIARNNYTVEEVERYLINDGIEAYGEGNGKYFETVEVQVFINILRIICNMRQDVPLISAMRSVVFGFSIRDLVEIRTQCRDGSFYSSVMAYAEGGRDEELRQRISDMIAQIDLWKEISRTVPLEDLMKIILYDTGYYDYCSGLPVGQQRISNLRLIAEKAAKYESISHGGLYGFLKYIETMEESGENDSEAKVLSESEDVVRVMSVHKSKGLEFPVVIFTNANRSTYSRGGGGAGGGSAGSAGISVHRDYGIALPKINRADHWHRKTFLQFLISRAKEAEVIEEEIRILYVALTRAKDCIEIVGSVKSEEDLPTEVSTKTFLSMIYEPFAARDEVEVLHYDDVAALEQAHELRMHKASELFEAAAAADCGAVAGVGADSVGEGSDDSEIPELIDRRLSYVYQSGGAEDAAVKPKYSVSELNGSVPVSGEIHLSEFAPDGSVGGGSEASGGGAEASGGGAASGQVASDAAADGQVGGGAGLTAAEIGTVMHLLMEKTDFAKAAGMDGGTFGGASSMDGAAFGGASDMDGAAFGGASSMSGREYVQSVADGLLADETISTAEYDALNIDNAYAFFTTEVGKRAGAAFARGELYKEKEFLLEKSIRGVNTVVQGIIDCYFQEGDDLVLIDYKNSYMGGGRTAAEIAEKYRGQIDLYREALEGATGKKVVESYLFLFDTGEFVKI